MKFFQRLYKNGHPEEAAFGRFLHYSSHHRSRRDFDREVCGCGRFLLSLWGVSGRSTYSNFYSVPCPKKNPKFIQSLCHC